VGVDTIFIPAVGDNKVFVYDKKFKFIKSIDIKGMPVFTSLSLYKKIRLELERELIYKRNLA
jgi:hypothetical protein